MTACWSRRVPDLLRSNRIVVVLPEQYRALLWQFDVSDYSWGHGGPLYFMGLQVVLLETIGM